jgi:hypothetical protein
MGLRERLARLEARSTAGWDCFPQLATVTVRDGARRIVAVDGGEAMQSWVGRPLAELKAVLPAGWIFQVIEDC